MLLYLLRTLRREMLWPQREREAIARHASTPAARPGPNFPTASMPALIGPFGETCLGRENSLDFGPLPKSTSNFLSDLD